MRRSRLATLAFAFLVSLVLAAPQADARERMARARKAAPKDGEVERTVTRTGPDGTARTSSSDTHFQRGNGKWTRDTVHTGPNGQQATTHVDGAKTENGHVRDVTRTGPNGKTSTTHDEVTHTDNGFTRNTTHTGPSGGVTTRNATGSYDPETKSWSKDVTTTGPNGKTSTTHVDGQRSDDGYTRSATHTGPNGGVTTVEGQGHWDPATKTWTREKVVTGPNGKTHETDVTTKVTPVTEPPAASD